MCTCIHTTHTHTNTHTHVDVYVYMCVCVCVCVCSGANKGSNGTADVTDHDARVVGGNTSALTKVNGAVTEVSYIDNHFLRK